MKAFILKYKAAIIATVLIAAVLTAAFLSGDKIGEDNAKATFDSAASDEEIAEIREMIAPIGNELISKKLIQMLNNKTRGFLYSRKEYLEKELEKVNRKIEEQL